MHVMLGSYYCCLYCLYQIRSEYREGGSWQRVQALQMQGLKLGGFAKDGRDTNPITFALQGVKPDFEVETPGQDRPEVETAGVGQGGVSD
jgi:hypothetical protein